MKKARSCRDSNKLFKYLNTTYEGVKQYIVCNLCNFLFCDVCYFPIKICLVLLIDKCNKHCKCCKCTINCFEDEANSKTISLQKKLQLQSQSYSSIPDWMNKFKHKDLLKRDFSKDCRYISVICIVVCLLIATITAIVTKLMLFYILWRTAIIVCDIISSKTQSDDIRNELFTIAPS